MDQATLMRLLGGLDTPDSVYGAMYEAPATPGQQFVDAYGQDYVGQAAGILGSIPGYEKAYPWSQADDALAWAKFLQGNAVNQAETAYDVSQDEFSNMVKQRGLEMDEIEMAADYGDPQATMAFLRGKGYDPRTVVNLFESDMTPEEFQANMDKLDQDIGELDEYGQPITAASPGGLPRRYRLYEYAKSVADEEDAAESQQLMSKRWGKLDTENRAKELYLRLQHPDTNIAVDSRGRVHQGADAELRVRDIEDQYRQEPRKRAEERRKRQQQQRRYAQERKVRTNTGRSQAAITQEARGGNLNLPGNMRFTGG